MLCNVPHKYGKPDASWLSKKRVKTYTINSFSGIVLNILPIVYLFLEKFCSRDPDLVDVFRLFQLMHTICGVLSSGSEQPTRHADALRRMMEGFHTIYALIADSCKPKLHHMHHIIDGMVWLGKLLSCFVCERKHRTVKDSALHVFRHIEHTVLADVINKQCHQLMHEGHDLFKEEFLVRPRQVGGVPDLLRSRHAVVHCGGIHVGDVVWCKDGRCGRVHMFYELQGSIVVSLHVYSNAMGDPTMFDEAAITDVFLDAREIVDACTWYYIDYGVIKVAVPPLFVWPAR